MKIYLDLQKQAITKTTDENIYQGDIYSNAFEILFYNYTDSNWFPTMSQLAPNGRKAGEFTADALDVGESHEYTEDGVTYLKFTFTMGTSWVLMKGRSEFYIWFNRLGGAIVQKKCVGVVNIMIDHSTEDYFIADPTFNPNVKTYIDACIAELGDGSPKYFDTASNIANCTEDKGLAVATDTGHLYYWDETKNSTTKYTDSGLVYNGLSNYYTKTQADALLVLKADKSNTYTKSEVYNKTEADALLAGKQNTLTFDSTPTANSTNPVTSGGVKTALDLKADKSTTYTKTEVDDALRQKVDVDDVYSKSQVNNLLDGKADKGDTYTRKVINNFVADLEIRKADKSNTYTKSEIDTTINGIGETLGLVEAAIDKLESVQNVVDVVSTKSALNSYNTSKLEVDDKIQVIADESHDSASTIYNWNGSAWVYVGAFGGNSYTKAETYNKTQIDSALRDKADKSDVYTKTEEDAKFEEVGQMFEVVGNEVLKKVNAEYISKGTTLTQTSYSNTNPSKSGKVKLYKLGGMSYKVNGTIQHSAVTKIRSMNGSTIVNSLSIPRNVQNLTGYGWGINDTCYNYIDFERKVFVQKVGRVLGLTYESNIIVATTLSGLTCVAIQTDIDLIASNEDTIVQLNNLGLTAVSAFYQWDTTETNVIACNDQKRILINFDQSLTDEEMIEKAKTLILYFKFITPIETDISSYITKDTLDVVEGGTLEFLNTYNQAVPNEIAYLFNAVTLNNIVDSNGNTNVIATKQELNEKSKVVANPTLSGDEATLEGAEIDGVKYKVGGSGKEYFHCIRYYNDSNSQAYINIKNNSNEPFTIVSLCTFLENLGCTNYTRLFVCSGSYKNNNVFETIIGCYRQGADKLRVDTSNNHETNFNYITDTVTEV